jgi:hypothetical protein
MPEGWTPPPPPEPDAEEQEVKNPPAVVPPRQPTPPQAPPGQSRTGEPQGSASVQSATAVQAEETNGLPLLTFSPPRLPVVVGKEAELDVILDPGAFGVNVPLNIAYDPTRLQVTRAEGGDLPGTNRQVRVEVTHTPALGWITATWKEKAVGSGTLVRMTVSPRSQGEIQVIFAGPIGAVLSKPATVVGLPGAAAEVPQ